MYSEFKSFEDLRDFVVNDKEATGLDVFTRNRYPIRFVLFDNFRDCSNFVELVQSEFGAIVESVDKWLDPEYPDIMITHVELAERIKEFIRKMLVRYFLPLILIIIVAFVVCGIYGVNIFGELVIIGMIYFVITFPRFVNRHLPRE